MESNPERSQYTAKKGFCDDLSEGKFSLPLIHFLDVSPAAGKVRDMLFCDSRETDLSQEDKAWVLSEMRSSGSLEYVREITIQLQHDILKTLSGIELELGPNAQLRKLMCGLRM